jgi:hypothetical protein
MDSKNPRGIGNVGLIIGMLLILLAILILFVNFRIDVNRDWLGNVTSASWVFPNMPYSIAIAVVGIVCIGIGSAFRVKDKDNTSRISRALYNKIQSPPPPNSKTFCPYCGTQNTPDADFCSKCGKKLIS